MRKNYTLSTGCVLLFMVLLTTVSCKKDKARPKPPTAPSFTFSMKDSLIIASQYATTDPDIYARYNGNTYTLNTKNKLQFIVHRMNANDFSITFQDTSNRELSPVFQIILKNTDPKTLQKTYDLTNTNIVQLHYHQWLQNWTHILNMNGKVNAGVLTIRYDQPYHTVTGEITGLQVPIDCYTPQDTAFDQPTRSNILLKASGSTRTASVKFTYAKITSDPW